MKTISAREATMAACLRAAKTDKVVITRRGKPVAIMLGADGLDLEQLELGTSAKFWKLMRKRRKEKTITHEELERRLAEWEKAGL